MGALLEGMAELRDGLILPSVTAQCNVRALHGLPMN